MDIYLRFITDGIRDTLDHYRRDDLPLHRLAWELRSRIDALAAHAPAVWIDQLRDLERRITRVHNEHGHIGLGPLGRGRVDDSLRQLQAVLENPNRMEHPTR
ncbi:MAG TPA: hypothetical protein VFE65_23215 [Pseudonocardia sp.]|jgi:hypothetical protein|nr:hypothetical protein [Pseudonocardia sp.]